MFWLITCFDLSQLILFLFLTVSFSSENSEKIYQASLLTKLCIRCLWIILTSSCLIFEFVFISGFLLSDMAKRFLLGRTTFFSEVLSKRLLFDSGRTGFLLTDKVYFIAAMNIPSSYHVKIIALLVGKIRGLIEARVILVLLQ